MAPEIHAALSGTLLGISLAVSVRAGSFVAAKFSGGELLGVALRLGLFAGLFLGAVVTIGKFFGVPLHVSGYWFLGSFAASAWATNSLLAYLRRRR
jgi:hypothetical protein